MAVSKSVPTPFDSKDKYIQQVIQAQENNSTNNSVTQVLHIPTPGPQGPKEMLVQKVTKEILGKKEMLVQEEKREIQEKMVLME